MGFDLVIRGATVVTPGHQEVVGIGIAGGRIAQLGGTMAGTQELAADGLLAIPGGVDAHTHLVHQGLGDRLEFPIWVDDFWSGSRAAIAGGITTIGNMTYPMPDEEGAEETPSVAVTREMAGAAPEAAVDWFLHPILLRPAALPEGEVAALAGSGHASIKMFLSDPDLAADEPALLAAAGAAKAAGSVTLLHCEDGTMLRQAGEQLIAEGRGAVANFPDARPVAAEVAAVDQAIGIARRTGARVYIVHLSSSAALDRCRLARAAGVPVYVETRPLYLHLTRERFAEPDAGKYAGAPPLREASDREALWAGLAAGDIDTVCSDHAPWTLDAKLDPELNAMTARQGVADLETLMPMLYSEGVAAGRISLDQFVDVTSANAARIFGLYPRKGAIAVGSDADIALWDPGRRRTIDGARMQSLSGYSVYDGWQVQGWPRFVVRRGQLVLADGEITARPGDGEWLRRNGTAGMLPLPARVLLLFCACHLPIRHLGNTTSVTPARSRTSASRSVAAMTAPRWFFRFMYDRESAAWERRRDEPGQRELVRRSADELANVVAPPGPVADLGCGPGAHALALARRGYDVIGVDGSPRMVEVARTRAARDKVDATFDVHDVSAPLRFADASLGGVLAILVVQHLPHPAAFVAEIRRCLRPGGHLLITAPARDSTSLKSQNLYWRLRAACYQLVPGVVRFYDTDSLPRLVEDQGLTVVECKGGPGRVSVLARACRGRVRRTERPAS